ncbi:MAG: ankyrin repeat domain-containing protein [Rubripirellula sp.]
MKKKLGVVLFCSLLVYVWIDHARRQSEFLMPSMVGASSAVPAKVQPVGHPTFVSPHASPICLLDRLVFVVNTPSDTVDVIDADTRRITKRIDVGIDPVSIAVRPDGKELWVSNHVSDSVSVIDTDSSSPTFLHVVGTVQDLDPDTKATRFDEPVGIAFASNEKAYVALSSENQIAIVDVVDREVTGHLKITAQDPRQIIVRNGLLYVIPFESNNKTQLSGGTGKLDGDLVTFNAYQHSIANNNVLSLGAVVDIIKHPRVPDRDLYVFDTESDRLVETVDSLGTLLYGMTVDSKGRVYISQTDARNEVNGRAGTKKHGLAELQNRAFLNRITSVLPRTNEIADSEELQADINFIELEPLPPEHPDPEDALATPFAIEVSDDDATLFVSAAGSDQFFTVDAANGKVLGRVAVGAVPRGIALQSDDSSAVDLAWTLNAVANTVSLVDVSNRSRPALIQTITLEDPTHPAVKRGRIAFNTAAASTTKTFACASCHPDGHTDQLLWVLKTPVVTGGDQIMPRSTMPIRGLRDTAPYHWDGIPGDPYGGNNSANVHGSDPPNSKLDDPASTTRHLIDGGIAATMSMVGDATVNDEGKPGALSAAERDDMAKFLLSVPYPPAQKRAYSNVVSQRAQEGFKLFHIDGDYDGKPKPNVCGNCHRMPFLVSTNTPGTGMDAPTWRGAYDRFLILPQGRLNIIDFDFYRAVAEQGIPERRMWQFSWGGRRRFDPIWDMVLEGSTGFSGAFARQVTLNKKTAKQELTADLLDSLEQAAAEGGIILQADGVLIDSDQAVTSLKLQYSSDQTRATYLSTAGERRFTREELVNLADAGEFIGTFSARHGVKADLETPQPALWTLGPLERQSGRQKFPILFEGNQEIVLSGRHLEDDANVLVDGRRVDGRVRIEGETVRIHLDELPDSGMHLLQVQNQQGLFSNDFIFHVTDTATGAARLQAGIDAAHVDRRSALHEAASKGNLDRIRRLLERGTRINERKPSGGSTALSAAALNGQVEAVKLLLRRGAKVDRTNEDGNTPLHLAAFMCEFEIAEILIDKGAPTLVRNRRGETPGDIVSSAWSDGLARFYAGVGRSLEVDLDVEEIRNGRPKMAKLLRTAREQDESGN